MRGWACCFGESQGPGVLIAALDPPAVTAAVSYGVSPSDRYAVVPDSVPDNSPALPEPATVPDAKRAKV
jgi:hypothetical protein